TLPWANKFKFSTDAPVVCVREFTSNLFVYTSANAVAIMLYGPDAPPVAIVTIFESRPSPLPESDPDCSDDPSLFPQAINATDSSAKKRKLVIFLSTHIPPS